MIRDRIQQAVSVSEAVWIERTSVKKLLRPLVYVDVGSSGGVPYRWRRLMATGAVDGYLVDPVSEWTPQEHPGATQVPFGFGETDGTHDFYETAYPGCSSCLEPNDEVLARYPARALFEVKAKGTIELRRADSVWAEYGYPQPDFVKIDVQGFEGAVLKGFGSLLNRTVGLELESHWVSLYRGQRLFQEMFDWLARRRFYLRHVEPQGPFEGEFVEANTYWLRRDRPNAPDTALWERLNHLPPARRFVESPLRRVVSR